MTTTRLLFVSLALLLAVAARADRRRRRSCASNDGTYGVITSSCKILWFAKEASMKTHELEVVIPEDHCLTVKVPETIRSGPATLILLVPAEDERTRADEIDRLYAEIRELMSRSAAGNGGDERIRDRFSRLRELQEEEADAMEARFRARHRLQPGEGRKALERARQIIEDESLT